MDNSTITTISIRNFKGIEDLQLNAKKLNAIIGKCGSGKSSLLDAIRFALTGKAGKEVIRKGCREASVVLRFSDNSTIERIRRTSENISKCNGKSSTKRSLDEFLTARNMNPCWIESLCSVDWFAGLSSKDLNNFFMTILPLRAKAETVVELVAQLDKDLTEKKEKYLMEEILKKQEIFSFNDLANGYNTAYTVRQELKRKYNEMLPRCTFNETVPAKTREDIEKELNNISQVEAAEKEYSKRLKEYASSKKQHDLAIKRLDEMKKELDTYSSCKKPKEETKTQAEADRKLFQVHIKRTNEYIGTINSTLDLLKRTLDNLDKPICPISEKLICTTDKSQLKEELLSLIQKNENTATKDLFVYLNAVNNSEILEKKTDEEILSFIEKQKTALSSFYSDVDDAVKRNWLINYLEYLKGHKEVSDEVYEAFLKKVLVWDTYEEMLEYMLDFGVYGEREAAKRCKDYPGVVLTTAHSSKGMEWPIVIDEISKYHDKNLRDEKDIEEKRRLFFVSATRARDELYVVAQRYAYGSKGNGKSIPDTRVQNIFLREAVWAVEQK